MSPSPPITAYQHDQCIVCFSKCTLRNQTNAHPRKKITAKISKYNFYNNKYLMFLNQIFTIKHLQWNIFRQMHPKLPNQRSHKNFDFLVFRYFIGKSSIWHDIKAIVESQIQFLSHISVHRSAKWIGLHKCKILSRSSILLKITASSMN